LFAISHYSKIKTFFGIYIDMMESCWLMPSLESKKSWCYYYNFVCEKNDKLWNILVFSYYIEHFLWLVKRGLTIIIKLVVSVIFLHCQLEHPSCVNEKKFAASVDMKIRNKW